MLILSILCLLAGITALVFLATGVFNQLGIYFELGRAAFLVLLGLSIFFFGASFISRGISRKTPRNPRIFRPRIFRWTSSSIQP